MTYTIGVTGYKGHIGQELLRYPEVVPLPCDVRKPDEVESVIRNVKVDIIVHLASISDVDFCEDPKNEKDVTSVNVRGTFHVAEAAEKLRRKMVLLSTSHVFSGKRGNYKEKANPNPVNFYGLTKMAAEGFQPSFPFMKIVRTSYLFDYERLFSRIYTLRTSMANDYPTFIERSFMYLPNFVESLYYHLINFDDMPGVLHISGTRNASWYEFMITLANVYGLNPYHVRPRDYEIQVKTAPRPYKAGLNAGLSKKLGLPQFDYREGLKQMRQVS